MPCKVPDGSARWMTHPPGQGRGHVGCGAWGDHAELWDSPGIIGLSVTAAEGEQYICRGARPPYLHIVLVPDIEPQ